MSNVVIIGAGPIGLYLAIQLKKAGVKNVVIYDPRAAEYSRPGHLNGSILNELSSKLNLSESSYIWNKKQIDLSETNHHIKDIERLLYVEAKKMSIKIEKKKFSRFNEIHSPKGIFVMNANQEEEFIACDYAFDCTGSKRELIHKVNEINKEKPFTIQPIFKSQPVKNYFLAYVNMKESDLEKINKAASTPLEVQLMPSLQFTQAIEQLRQLGWKEYTFPLCYGVPFNKDKVCLYMECPEQLDPQLYEKWVSSVINGNTLSKDIKFQQLPPSKLGIKKPHFHSFIVDPQELTQAEYSSKLLPSVIAMGDTQIDPHFYLAHGVRDGLKRVHQLIEHIEVYNGQIAYYDSSEYLSSIKTMLNEHKNHIIHYYKERIDYFKTMVYIAETHYEEALLKSSNELEQLQLQSTLKEIKALISFYDAIKELNQLNKAIRSEKQNLSGINDLDSKLSRLTSTVLLSLREMPKAHCQKERLQDELFLLASSWKELGNHYFSMNRADLAIKAYTQVMITLKTANLTNEYQNLELITLSNMLICNKKLKRYEEAISLGKNALEDYPNTLSLETGKRKIVFHMVKMYAELINKEIENHNSKAATEMSQTILKIYSVNKSIFADNEGKKVWAQLSDDIEFFRKFSANHSGLAFFNSSIEPENPELSVSFTQLK